MTLTGRIYYKFEYQAQQSHSCEKSFRSLSTSYSIDNTTLKPAEDPEKSQRANDQGEVGDLGHYRAIRATDSSRYPGGVRRCSAPALNPPISFTSLSRHPGGVAGVWEALEGAKLALSHLRPSTLVEFSASLTYLPRLLLYTYASFLTSPPGPQTFSPFGCRYQSDSKI